MQRDKWTVRDLLEDGAEIHVDSSNEGESQRILRQTAGTKSFQVWSGMVNVGRLIIDDYDLNTAIEHLYDLK